MIGGGTAWLMWKRFTWITELLFKPWLLLLSLISFPFLSYLAHPYPFIQDIIYLPLACCFAIIIVNVAQNPDSFIKMNWKWTGYLGTVSYGFYMYHLMILFAVVKLSAGWDIEGNWWSELGIVILAFLCTFIVSVISYEFFEKGFIRLKKKFSK